MCKFVTVSVGATSSNIITLWAMSLVILSVDDLPGAICHTGPCPGGMTKFFALIIPSLISLRRFLYHDDGETVEDYDRPMPPQSLVGSSPLAFRKTQGSSVGAIRRGSSGFSMAPVSRT